MDQPWQLESMMEQMSPSSYRFSVEINCTQASAARWSHQTEPWFILFYVLCDALQMTVCLLALLCNAVAFVALGRVESDSTLALQLRSLAVSDTVFVLGNTIDNACHTLESLPAAQPTFFYFAIYAHPIAWALRAPFLTVHNWTMVFVSVVRYAKIRWPIRANLWFARSRTAACLAAIWVAGLATSLIRCLEVTTVYCLCPDGFYRAAIVATKVFPAYTSVVNYGLQTVTPVAVAVVVNVLLLHSLRQRGLRFRAGGESGQHRGSDAKQVNGQRRETTWVIVLLLQLYLFCQIPMILFGFNVLLTVPTPVYIVIGLVGNFIASLDGACNFFIYVYANPRFRYAVRRLLRLPTGGAKSAAAAPAAPGVAFIAAAAATATTTSSAAVTAATTYAAAVAATAADRL